MTIFWDVNFSIVHKQFDEAGNLRDPAFLPRIDKFLKELIWMARTLRTGASTSRWSEAAMTGGDRTDDLSASAGRR